MDQIAYNAPLKTSPVVTREFGELRRLTLKLTLLRKREKKCFD